MGAVKTLAEVTALLERVDAWLSPTRDLFRLGLPVTVAVSPGDATQYGIVFVPAGMGAVSTQFERASGLAPIREIPRPASNQAVLALVNDFGFAIPFNPNGNPDPSYVRSHIGKQAAGNDFTVCAVGIIWALMVGNAVSEVASLYHQEFERQLAEWEPERFEPFPEGGAERYLDRHPTLQPKGGHLTVVDPRHILVVGDCEWLVTPGTDEDVRLKDLDPEHAADLRRTLPKVDHDA